MRPLLSTSKLRLALAAGLATLAATMALASDHLGSGGPKALRALAPAELDAPRQQVVTRGADRRTAEALLGEAIAGIYLEGTGEVRGLLATPRDDGAAASLASAAGVATAAPLSVSGRTLREFLDEAQRDLARGDGDHGPFIVKAPGVLAAPAGLRLLAHTSVAAEGAAQAVILSEGFEADPWVRWQRSDSSGGSYTWAATACDKHSGASAADAVRGGTTGSGLTCGALYPNSLQTWIVDGQCESFAGAGQAWLDAYISVSSEQGYDYLFIGYERSGGDFLGSLYWGNLPGWWRVVFNLKQWYGIGDLSARACNQLAFVFDADSTIASGWGARVDDVTITTDAPAFITCSAAAAPASGKAPLDVAFTPTVAGASGSAQYDWRFDDGAASAATAPTHRYVVPGEFYPTLSVEDASTRCEAATRVTVAGSGVVPSAGTFTGTTDQGKPISFTIDGSGTLTGYSLGWSCTGASGDVTVSSAACPVTDGSFDCGTVACQTYTVKARLQGTFATPTTAVGVLSYGIRPAAGASCCFQYDIPFSAAIGTASCTLGCNATVPAAAVAGSAVALQAASTPTNCTSAVTYDWNFGDGSAHSTQQNPSHTWASAGTYSWSMSATADGVTCTQSGSITVTGTVSCTLGCNATVPATAVAGSAVALQAASTPTNCTSAVTYDWNFGDASAHSTQQNPSHTWVSAGTYSWSMSATADGVTCTQSGSIAVAAAPSCSVGCTATVPATGVVDSPVQLLSTATPANCSGAATYDWDYGDGSTHGTTQNPSHTWSQTGTFAWTLTVAVDGQTCTRSGSITIGEPTPCSLTCTASVTSSTSVGQSVSFWGSATLSNCTGSASYDWDFGDGTAHGTDQMPSHAYAAAGTYTWTLTVTADGASCTRTGTIGVCGIECSATVPASSRVGAPVPFQGSATSTGCMSSDRYEWDFGDGTAKSSTQSPTHAYAAAGTYTWTMKVTNVTVTCTRTGTISIGDQVACTDCTATVPSTTEAGVETPFQSDLTPADCAATRSFQWSFGDGDTSYEQSPKHRYCSTGAFTWTLTATINGATCTKTGVISVGAPTALACSVGSLNQAPACPATLRFRPEEWWCTDETSYTWDFGDGQSSTERWLDHAYTAQGTYTYTMTASLAGGTCTATGTIVVGPPAAITCSATPPSVWGAPPLTVDLQAAVEPAGCITSASYAWDLGDGSTSAEQNPSHTYAADGYYPWTMTVTAEGATCSDSGFVVVSSETPDYTWVQQPSGTTQPLMDVQLTAPDEGWAAGSNGALRHTTDGGKTWTKVGTFSDSYDFRAVHFVDRDTGWLLRHESIGRTADRGATWKWHTTSAWSERDLFATSATSAWMTGRTYYIPGLFYPFWDRYDAQANGSIIDGPSINISIAGYQYEWSYGVWFVDQDNGWSVGSRGWIYKITNASTSSPTIAKHSGNGPTGADLYRIQMLDANTGWAVGAGGTIIHTTDAWQSWTAQPSGVTTPLRALYFADPQRGWVVGDHGLIVTTSDGGATWVLENSGTSENLHSVHGATAAVAAQSDGADVAVIAAGDGGTILKRLSTICGTIAISPATLPAASRGVAYSATLTAAGGTAPYTFSVASGALPPGLTLSAEGVLSGTPSTAGVFAFGVAATDANGCSGAVQLSLVVPCTMTCYASAYQLSSPPLTASFSSTVTEDCQGATTYLWQLGDGSSSAEADPQHTYAAPGVYSWSFTATADGATCTKTGTVHVCAVTCSASVPSSSRVGATVPFAATGSSTGCQYGTVYYDWDFGDGSPHGWGAPEEHTYTAVGTYTWTLEASSGLQKCTRTGTITIAEAVACTDCSADVPATTEVGSPTPFRSLLAPADCSATLTYEWTFGDGDSYIAANPSHTYCAVGTYPWTLTVTIGGVACSRSGTITVTAPTALDCSATVGETGACPYSASFYGQTSGCNSQSTYEWTFGDGGTATSSSPTHMYTAQGSYDWTMTTTLAGATCSRSGTLSVTAPTAITAVGSASATWGAPPLAVGFEGDLAYPACVSSVAYAWSFGDGASSALQDPSHTYAAEGFYTWVLTATAGGLTSTAEGPVIVTTQAPLYTWAPQLSGTLDPISDASFLSETEGWTAAQRGLRRTTDAGRTWSLSRDTIAYAVRFYSASAGFFVYSCGVGRTSSGGSSWTIYPYDSCPSWSFTDVFPTSPTFAWATTNSGRLWYFDIPPGSSISYGWRTTESGNLRSLWFTDADNGWAVGSGGKIIRLFNTSGTVNDEVQPSGTTVRLNGVRMLDANNGWIVGDDGTILHTTSGGTSWSPVASGTTIDLLAIDFRDGNTAWIVGKGGLVLATTDGGATWHPEVNGWPADLRSVSAPAGDAVYAAGANGALLKRLPIVCPEITLTPASLPPAAVGVPYSQTLAGSGGSPPYRLGLAAGSLLEGLQLASSGSLSGTPEATGPADFTARAVDAEFCSGDSSYTLTTGCAVACTASAAPLATPLTASFSSDATDSCGSSVAAFWTFGDGASSAQADTQHTYAAAGTYSWTFTATADGRTCTRSGTVTVTAACAVTCSATAPAAGQAGSPVAFQATATATGCAGGVTYQWGFGDGSSSSQQNPGHAYAAAGTYTWTLTAAAAGQSCTRSGVITISGAPPAAVYLVPSAAHNPGAAGTQWRTDVAVVNRGATTAQLALTYYSDSQTLTAAAALAPNATVEWRDILVDRFGLAPGASSSGALHIAANVPLSITSRTYNQTAAGTYGQYYPALTAADALTSGETGMLPQLKKSGAFRTNIGLVNLGTASCGVAVRLLRADGAQVGSTKVMTVAAGRWLQQYDIFNNVGAGNQEVAYARVEVQTAGGAVWAYASVIDSATGDPTTVPILVPPAAAGVTATATAAYVYMVPSVAHNPGVGGTQWRTDVGIVNHGAQTANLVLTFNGSGAPIVRNHTLAAGAACEWRNLLETLFGLAPGASNQGTVHIASDTGLCIGSRTYNQTTAGTYGQYYPACTARHAITSGQVGILPQLKKNGGFRTNVGVQNLGDASAAVLVRVFDAAGVQVGSKSLTVAAGRWSQQNDIFAAAGAGNQDIAYATVEVQTAGGTVWVYGSVVDQATGDPTTIPVLLQ